MQSFKTPTRNQVDTALQRMRSPDFAMYFLSRLENPRWIAPLRNAGVFASPPPIVQVEGGHRFPHWPASKFLVRMASHAPDEVAQIFASLETNNPSVVGDLVKAALAMETAVAASLVPSICKYSDAGLLWIYLKDASQLCTELANNGHGDEAMMLAASLFRPRSEGEDEGWTRRDEHWYKKCLHDVVPSLARATPAKAIVAMCEWLESSIMQQSGVDADSGTDFSRFWRPAVEDHTQNSDYNLAGVLLGVVRSCCELVVQDGGLSLEDVLTVLSGHKFMAFQRLRVHLVDRFAEQAEALAQEMILTREWLDCFERKYEYAMLVGRRWSLLSPTGASRWLQWVDDGPDMSSFDESFKRGQGREATEADRIQRVKYWQLEKLHWVRDHLTDSWKALYGELLEELGEPEFAYMHMRTGRRWGSDSPFTVEDLEARSFEDAVRLVVEWRREGSRYSEPSYEGLASTFQSFVQTNAEAVSEEAQRLIDAPAIYVRGFLHAMTEAAKEGRPINIHAIAELARWVLAHPALEGAALETREGVVETDWQWTRDAVSRFVSKVCQARDEDAVVYSHEYKDEIWPLLETLCTDQAESTIVRESEKEDPRVHDYLDLGIDSPRGRALEGVLEYARWIAAQLDKTNEAGEFVGDFSLFPEVRTQLEKQLAPGNRHVEVLSVIGSRFSLMYWLDKKWLEANADALCGKDAEGQTPGDRAGWGAWNAILVWNRPRSEFYRLLRLQFSHAVDEAAHIELPDHERMQPMNQLGEHLLLLYGRGEIGIDDDNGVVRRLIASANPRVRRHAMSFVGRLLDEAGEIPSEMIDRFRVLWDLYWSSVGPSDAASHQGSFLFGTWFSCGKFPNDWAIERMLEFVEVDPIPEPDHSIVQRLARVADEDATTAVRILDRMVHGDKEGWRVLGWIEAAEEVLRTAMAAGGTPRKEAEALIQYLGRRGHEQFGELLRKNG